MTKLYEGYRSRDGNDGLMSLQDRNHHLLQIKTLFLTNFTIWTITLSEEIIFINWHFLECTLKVTTWPQLKNLDFLGKFFMPIHKKLSDKE